MNWCNDRPEQKWNWIRDRHGTNMIQLKDTSKCLGRDSSDGGPIVLSECAGASTAARRFNGDGSHWSQAHLEASSASSTMRHVQIYMLALVGFGAVSLAVVSTKAWKVARV